MSNNNENDDGNYDDEIAMEDELIMDTEDSDDSAADQYKGSLKARTKRQVARNRSQRISPIQQGEHSPKAAAIIAKVILLFGRDFSEKEAVSIGEYFYLFSFKYTTIFLKCINFSRCNAKI